MGVTDNESWTGDTITVVVLKVTGVNVVVENAVAVNWSPPLV